MSTRRDLIHPRVRSAFREAASDCGVVRQIERAFDDEGLDPSSSRPQLPHPLQRRGLSKTETRLSRRANPVEIRYSAGSGAADLCGYLRTVNEHITADMGQSSLHPRNGCSASARPG